MPRVKTGHVARAACAVAVIALYCFYSKPWSSASPSKPGVWRGGGADVLDHVNMFIGTINGGEAGNPDYEKLIIMLVQVMLSQELPYLMVSEINAFSRMGSCKLTKTGMAKASADCIGEAHGGFASDGSDISGFSHMHDSGTGGVSCLINSVSECVTND